MNWWLVLDYVLISVVRHVYSHIYHSMEPYDAEPERLSPRAFKLLTFCLLPLVGIWTGVGTYWFVESQPGEGEEQNEGTTWVCMFWLAINYFIILMVILTLLGVILDRLCPETEEERELRMQHHQALLNERDEEGLNTRERNQILEQSFESWVTDRISKTKPENF